MSKAGQVVRHMSRCNDIDAVSAQFAQWLIVGALAHHCRCCGEQHVTRSSVEDLAFCSCDDSHAARRIDAGEWRAAGQC